MSSWVIYVDIHAEYNFDVAFDLGVWGAKDRDRFIDPGSRKEIGKGDRLCFVRGINYITPISSPRSKDDYYNNVDSAEEVIVAEVTTDVFKDYEKIWGDDLYPYRFKHYIMYSCHKKKIRDVLPEELLEPLRLSMVRNGQAYLFDDDSMEKLWEAAKDWLDED